MYRGEQSSSSVIKSYAAKEGGYAHSQSLINNGSLDDLMRAHAFDSKNPASPFISATSDPAIARFFAGPNGVVHTLSVPTNRAIFNTFNNYVIPGIGREAEYLIPNYIRPSEFIR